MACVSFAPDKRFRMDDTHRNFPHSDTKTTFWSTLAARRVAAVLGKTRQPSVESQWGNYKSSPCTRRCCRLPRATAVVKSPWNPFQALCIGNSKHVRLRNHSTSDSQTLTQTRAASCHVSASTLQGRAVAVREAVQGLS